MINNIGIGVDIENIDRFKEKIKKGRSFLRKIFSKRELDYCLSKINPALHLAARYAGKEAVIKAISNLDINGLNYLDYKKIEIINNSKRVPLVKLININLSNIKFKISLSHSQDKALAFVIAMEVK